MAGTFLGVIGLVLEWERHAKVDYSLDIFVFFACARVSEKAGSFSMSAFRKTKVARPAVTARSGIPCAHSGV